MRWLRSLAAVVIGYATMVGAAWFAQEEMFPGAAYGTVPIGTLLACGFFTSAGGGLGGAVTAILAPHRQKMQQLPMAFLISLETVTLYAEGKVHGPLWFELLAGISLIAGTFAGAWIWLLVDRWLANRKLTPAAG